MNKKNIEDINEAISLIKKSSNICVSAKKAVPLRELLQKRCK